MAKLKRSRNGKRLGAYPETDKFIEYRGHDVGPDVRYSIKSPSGEVIMRPNRMSARTTAAELHGTTDFLQAKPLVSAIKKPKSSKLVSPDPIPTAKKKPRAKFTGIASPRVVPTRIYGRIAKLDALITRGNPKNGSPAGWTVGEKWFKNLTRARNFVLASTTYNHDGSLSREVEFLARRGELLTTTDAPELIAPLLEAIPTLRAPELLVDRREPVSTMVITANFTTSDGIHVSLSTNNPAEMYTAINTIRTNIK
jgi:hypothetical protein